MPLSKTEKLVLETLAGKPFYKSSDGPILARILDQCCQSHDHRRRVCDKALLMRFGNPDNPEDRCPGPAELAELCREVAPVVMQEAKGTCRYCAGSGFEVGEDGASRCRCGGFPMSDESRSRFLASEGDVTDNSDIRDLIESLAAGKRL